MKERVYDKYKKHCFWKIIDKAIKGLTSNGDMEETTDHYYIVGYLTKCLCEQENRNKAEKQLEKSRTKKENPTN